MYAPTVQVRTCSQSCTALLVQLYSRTEVATYCFLCVASASSKQSKAVTAAAAVVGTCGVNVCRVLGWVVLGWVVLGWVVLGSGCLAGQGCLDQQNCWVGR